MLWFQSRNNVADILKVIITSTHMNKVDGNYNDNKYTNALYYLYILEQAEIWFDNCVCQCFN